MGDKWRLGKRLGPRERQWAAVLVKLHAFNERELLGSDGVTAGGNSKQI